MSLILKIYQQSLLPAVVGLWNESVTEWPGFYPQTEETFTNLIINNRRFRPEYLLIAEVYGTKIGWIHLDIVDVPPYERAGVINAMLIHPDYRYQGYGTKILQEAIHVLERKGVHLIDAMGAWPYSSFYATMIDGSERAGVPNDQRAMIWLLDKCGFMSGRKSTRMRCKLATFNDEPQEGEQVYYQTRLGKNTWLDYAFRGWELFDHVLISDSGKVLSRAVHARMTGQSAYENNELHSVFGVNTPESQRGKGYATRNLQLMLSRIKRQYNGQEAELHVYTDNFPAVKLYSKLGFIPKGKCTAMQRR